MAITDVHGRVIGARALATRTALLGALKELLDRYPAHNVTVKNVADRVGCSPASFYQYFPHLDNAYRVLAEDAEDTYSNSLWARQATHIAGVLDEVTTSS